METREFLLIKLSRLHIDICTNTELDPTPIEDAIRLLDAMNDSEYEYLSWIHVVDTELPEREV